MDGMTRMKIMLPPPHEEAFGPGWTDVWTRDAIDSDQSVIDEIWIEDVYRTRGLDKSGWQDIGRGPIIDAGANIGAFSLLCLSYHARQVIAIEPSPANLAILSANVGAKDKVQLRTAALTGDGRPVKLSGEGGGTRLDDAGLVEVESITLASILEPLSKVAFLKCLDAETRVATRRGALRLIELIPGDEVWRDGRWRLVEAVIRSPRRAGIEVATDGGRKLRLTPEHRLWADGAWRRADSFIIGTCLSTGPESPGELPLQRCAWPPAHRATRTGIAPDFANAPDAPSVEITERWGRFLGLFAGDGSCSAKGRVAIACDGQDADLIASIMEDVRAMGLAPGTEAVTTRNGQVLRRRVVYVPSVQLVRFLVSLGVADWSTPDARYPRRIVCVPEVIWRSPRGVIAQFLAGLFEADGSVSHRGVVSLTSKDGDFLSDVQQLLGMFGVEAVVSKQRASQRGSYSDRVYWSVRLRRAAMDVFAKEIRFLSLRKNAILDAVVARPWGPRVQHPRWQERITELRPCELDPVDIAVDGSVFMARGFVSHNCDIEGAEYEVILNTPHAELAKVDRIAMEWHSSAMMEGGAMPPLGAMLEWLAETHSLDCVGRASVGGMLFANSYSS